jgi:hypothetical protein
MESHTPAMVLPRLALGVTGSFRKANVINWVFDGSEISVADKRLI